MCATAQLRNHTNIRVFLGLMGHIQGMTCTWVVRHKMNNTNIKANCGLWVIYIMFFYMFQSILNIFGFSFLCVRKINYFHGWGVPFPPPLAENSAKIINLIFEPFP